MDLRILASSSDTKSSLLVGTHRAGAGCDPMRFSIQFSLRPWVVSERRVSMLSPSLQASIVRQQQLPVRSAARDGKKPTANYACLPVVAHAQPNQVDKRKQRSIENAPFVLYSSSSKGGSLCIHTAGSRHLPSRKPEQTSHPTICSGFPAIWQEKPEQIARTNICSGFFWPHSALPCCKT